MKTPRWLLPFTFGVDMAAIDSVVRLAESAGATLLPVSLVSSPFGGARPEHIQQSKDFLEAMHYIAARYHVQVERYEVFTPDVQESLTTLVYQMQCDGIVLVTDGEQACFMQGEEVKRLLVKPPAALVLIRQPARSGSAPRLRTKFLSWLHRRWESLDGTLHPQAQDAQVGEESLWIRTELQHPR